MKQFRNNVIRAGLGAALLHRGALSAAAVFSGVGVIFMLHHVRPGRDVEFQPNHHLEVAPEFMRDAGAPSLARYRHHYNGRGAPAADPTQLLAALCLFHPLMVIATTGIPRCR
jgi:hypothetical protein